MRPTYFERTAEALMTLTTRTALKTTLILFALFATTSVAAERIDYDWLTLGEKSGQHSISQSEDGEIVIEFSFSDRGRGPKVREVLKLDDQGLITHYHATGHGYMGSKIDEKFNLREGVATWSSEQESGSSVWQQDGAMYLPGAMSPEVMAVLVRAMKAKPDNAIDLLPSGRATVEQVLETKIKNVQGVEKTVKLMAVSGLGFTPDYAWFDEHDRLFAVAYGWMGMTPAGWHDSLADLQSLQDKVANEFHAKISSRLTQNLPNRVLIDNVNVLDVEQGKVVGPTSVLIEQGIIRAIDDNIKNSDIDEVLDGQGKTLMPGLWDMHAHIRTSNGLLQMAAGVTSVRDLGNKHEDLEKTIAAFEAGTAIGPNVYKAGFIDKKSEYAAPTGKLVETLDEALEAIDWYAERGYIQIKIYSSISPDWVVPIAKRAKKHGMKLSGHIPSFMSTEQAVKDGFDEIQHINMLFLNFLAGPDDDTRTPVRFTLVGERASTVDLDSKEVKAFLSLLKENQVVVDPTITIFTSLFLQRPGVLDSNYAMIADHLPANVRRGMLSSSMEINEENDVAYTDSANALKILVKKLYDAGIQLVAGTDSIAGFTLHRELELYAEAGIPVAEVLKIATIDSARVVGAADKTGSIEAGKLADLVLIDGNPLQDISAIRRVVWTMRRERLYSASDLYKSVGVKPFTNLP